MWVHNWTVTLKWAFCLKTLENPTLKSQPPPPPHRVAWVLGPTGTQDSEDPTGSHDLGDECYSLSILLNMGRRKCDICQTVLEFVCFLEVFLCVFF